MTTFIELMDNLVDTIVDSDWQDSTSEERKTMKAVIRKVVEHFGAWVDALPIDGGTTVAEYIEGYLHDLVESE